MRLGLSVLLVCIGACGASAPPPTSGRVAEVDLEPAAYLLRWAGEWNDTLARPAEDSASLKDAIRGLRGSERHEMTIRYIMALIHEAETLEDDSRELRRARRDIRKALRRLRRVRGDLATTRDFIELVAAWRGELPRAVNLAERFTDRHSDSATLHGLAWMILGEIYSERRRLRDAARSYRYLLGDLEHALYPFALWRTSAVLREQDRADEADEILPQIVRLACPSETPESTQEIAAAAASEASVARVGDRYTVCEGDEQGRNVDEELPPGYR